MAHTIPQPLDLTRACRMSNVMHPTQSRTCRSTIHASMSATRVISPPLRASRELGFVHATIYAETQSLTPHTNRQRQSDSVIGGCATSGAWATSPVCVWVLSVTAWYLGIQLSVRGRISQPPQPHERHPSTQLAQNLKLFPSNFRISFSLDLTCFLEPCLLMLEDIWSVSQLS